MPSDRLLSTNPQAGRLLSEDPSASAKPAAPQPTQPFGALGIKTVSDEDWAAMSPQERVAGLLKAAGYGISSMLGMREAGNEAVDNPKTTLASAAIEPVAAGVNALRPSVLKSAAGQQFQQVMGAVGPNAVETGEAGNAALRIHDLAERGNAMPKTVRDFLKRVTDPTKGELTYNEARDFESSMGRLSAAEAQRLAPPVRAQLSKVRTYLRAAVTDTARAGGQEEAYKQAMKKYALGSKIDDAMQNISDYVLKNGLKWAVGGAAGALGYQLFKDKD